MSDTAEQNEKGSGSVTAATAESIFDPVIEAAPVALILVNSAGTICLVNRQTELLFEYSRDYLIAQPIEKLLPEEFRQGHPSNRRGYLEDPKPRLMGSGRDLFGQTQSGKKIAIEIGLNPIHTQDGAYVLASVIDVSERKEAEKLRNELNESLSEQVRETRRALNHLQETQSQLVQAEKMASLGGLVAGVAHEINTPVGIGVTAASHLKDEVTKVSEAVQSGKLTKKQFADFVEMTVVTSQMILTNLGRAADLIQSFKRVAVDRSSDETRVIDVSEYLDEILLSLKPRFKHTPHEVILESEPDLRIETAPGAWSQIITNLVLNAQIHGLSDKEPGKILVTAKRENSQLKIEVEDNGKGISSENLEKVFDPFFTTRRGEGGSGLGLNIVFNLVTQTIGGKISVNSVVGQWTRFTILLPLK